MRELIIDLSLWIDYYCTCLAYAYNCLIKQLVLFYEITTVPCHLIVRKAFKELMTGVVPISKMCGSDNFQMDNRTYGYHRVWTNVSEDRNIFFGLFICFSFSICRNGAFFIDRYYYTVLIFPRFAICLKNPKLIFPSVGVCSRILHEYFIISQRTEGKKNWLLLLLLPFW